MANFLPMEYFGLAGLGSGLGQLGDAIQADRERKRQKSFQELMLEGQLNPEARAELFARAKEVGLIDPKATYAPTLQEKFFNGTLTPEEMAVYGPQLGLAPGQSLGQATELAGLNVEGARLDVARGKEDLTSAERANRYAEDFELSLNNPIFLRAAGLPEDAEVTPGTIEALRVAQNMTTENLRNEVLGAQARYADERERAELAELYKRSRLIDFQISQMRKEEQADDGTLAWMKNLSQNTVWSPAEIRAALDKNSGLTDEQRQPILDDINNYQESMRADIRKKIREGNSQAGQTLTQLIEWANDGVAPFPPDDPSWQIMMAEATRELGIPAVFIPGVERRFWFDTDPQFLIGAPAANYMEQARQLVGEQTTDVPTIDRTTATQYATGLLSQYGSAEKALEFVNNSTATDADKRVLIEAIQNTQESSEVPAEPTPKEKEEPQEKYPTPEAAYEAYQKGEITAQELYRIRRRLGSLPSLTQGVVESAARALPQTRPTYVGPRVPR